MDQEEFERDLILTSVTFGFFGFWWILLASAAKEEFYLSMGVTNLLFSLFNYIHWSFYGMPKNTKRDNLKVISLAILVFACASLGLTSLGAWGLTLGFIAGWFFGEIIFALF